MHTVVGWLVEFRSVIKSATADCDEVDTVAEGYSVTNVTASMWVSGDKRLLFITRRERETDIDTDILITLLLKTSEHLPSVVT